MQKCFLVSLWNSVPKHGARPPAPLTPPAIMYVQLIIVCVYVLVRVCIYLHRQMIKTCETLPELT